MWRFRKKFERSLGRQAGRLHVTGQTLIEGMDKSMDSIGMDFQGFYAADDVYLGQLAALLLGQAQAEGASRVQLYYGNNRMVYTIGGTDYDMVPCPPPMNVDYARAMAKAAGIAWDRPGTLTVAFADTELALIVTHHFDAEDPYLEITGFTGIPRVPQREACIA